MRVAVLCASYNEGERLAGMLASLRAIAPSIGDVHAFVTDDGGRKVRRAALPQATPHFRLTLARHPVNLGQGAALETARRMALEAARVPFDAYVTMDADGQHGAADLPALLDAIAKGADVALGDRFAAGSVVPRGRKLLLRAARAFESLLLGRPMQDAHNGFRAFGPRAIRHVALRRNGMAHATEIALQVVRPRKLSLAFVPVTIRYTDASLAKGQRASSAITIVRDLAHGFLFDPARAS